MYSNEDGRANSKKGPLIRAENDKLKDGLQSLVLVEELEATVTEL